LENVENASKFCSEEKYYETAGKNPFSELFVFDLLSIPRSEGSYPRKFYYT